MPNVQTWCKSVHPTTGIKCGYGAFHPRLPHTAKLSEVRTPMVTANGARYVLVTDAVFESWNHNGEIVQHPDR